MATPNDTPADIPNEEAGRNLLGGVLTSLPAPDHEIYAVLYDCTEAIKIFHKFLMYKSRETEPVIRLRNEATDWIKKINSGIETAYHLLPQYYPKEKLGEAIRTMRLTSVGEPISMSDSTQLNFDEASQRERDTDDANGFHSTSSELNSAASAFEVRTNRPATFGGVPDSPDSNQPPSPNLTPPASSMSSIPAGSHNPNSGQIINSTVDPAFLTL